MKNSILLLLSILYIGLRAQSDSLTVYYYENYPYAYTEANKAKGLEVDIIEEYSSWLKQKKNRTLIVSYKPFAEFSSFYNAVKNGGSNVIGLGSVTWNAEREREVAYSAPYLRNVAVLITAGTVPTVKTKFPDAIAPVFGKLKAVGVNGSSHMKYLNEIKTNYLPDMKVTLVESQVKVLESIVSDPLNYGFVDIVAYWTFLKNNPTKFLKIQKVFNEPKEVFGFIFPKNGSKLSSVNEFFESGFGFTSTKKYRQILEKYLGYEIIDDVEIK
jgi:ABC-type amino acid transport substrate-binding protein